MQAKEIKQHLSIKGQDVDETVICELLESFLDSNNHEIDRTQYIINMIMGNQDFDFQTSSDEAGPSIKTEHEGHNDIKKSLELDVHSSPTKSAETIDVSDSEDDRDYYYDFITNYDDTSIVNTIATRSSSCSVLDADLDQIRDNVDQSIPEIEFLKENNNNDVIYMKIVKNATYENARLSESPKPGCSKDLDNRSQSPEEYCYPCDVDELQIDAEQINTLLPNLDYDLIYKTLRNNQLAKNRVELTLWDLLPEERPSPQLTYKRKCMPYEMHSVKNKKNSGISQEKDVADTNMLLETKEQACARNEIITIDIELKNKESMTLENETEKMEIDITEDATATNNTDNDMNNQQTDMIPEAKLICLDTSANDVNVCKDVYDTKKSDSLENNSKNEELQSSTNSAVPQKEINDISTTNLQSILQSIAIPNVAMPNTVVSNTPAVSTVIPKTTVQSTIVPSTATQNIVMSSIAVPNTVVPSIMPNTAMSNTIVQSTAVLSTIMPSIAMPSTIVSSTAVPSTAVPSTAVPSTAVPSTAVPSTATPRTLQIAMPGTSGPATSRPAMPVLRPAKFTVLSAGASSTAPSSKHSIPILKPSKLKHVADRLQNLMNARETNNHTTMKTMNNMRAEVNKKEVHEALHFDNTFRRDFVHACLNSSVKSAPPNKMLSNVKTEKMKFLEERAVPITGSTKPSSAQLLNNLTKRNTLLSIQSEGATKYKEYLNIHLRKDSNVEVKNNLRQKDNTLQTYSTEMEKQNFMLAVGMEPNANKVKQIGIANNTGQQEIVLNKKALELYYKLIPMFPAVDTIYIKLLCQNHIEANLLRDESVLLQNLVEHLLDNGQKHPSVKRAKSSSLLNTSNTYDLNEQYADLLGIFPEADPIYLRKVAEEMYEDPEKIKEFVQSKLENPDFPTRAEYLAKKKITEQQKQYTSDFKIQQFLELFPDPFSHFENANRQCKFNPHGVDFLKHHFNKIRVNTLLNTYTENLHNLSLTAKALEVLSPNMKTRRSQNKMMLTEDIPLLQECAFIQHKLEIKMYLTELKDQEKKEFEELKAKNELIECQCCFDNECMPSKCSTCEEGHIFCNSCIVRSTELILANGKTHVDCLLNCGSEFPLSVLQQVLPPTKFSILLCKRQEAEVMAAGLEGLVSCPFCHFASIPPPEDKVFRCLNPNCMKESCRFCKELNHIPLKCNEGKSDVARLYLEEKMTEALVRKCYKCSRTFFKEEGCNKMTCLCGAQMCYICDKPVTSYGHFQGQGVRNSTLCPLWSDDRRMNAESVIKVCQETLKHIKQKNPEVDINVNALLPKLPPKTRGPHEDVVFANTIPAHAERIVRHNP
ncbi:uncharacterized protein LOC126855281 isoform X2 [Cataglyphis hispanica]|uniref:uncharacterized protein LOC126855281 isoform X2 n=1 Tax=Cataglyphis hispanica TaxID=1086592 RepID=UPI0021804A1F|nr:uncharacterized protein LOC126855281 isoform X2 [Cataglyphis hispanica]